MEKKRIEKEELKIILENNKKGLKGNKGGKVGLMDFDFSSVDLRDVNLIGLDLSYANLRNVDLSGTDLNYADLSEADLRGANLRGADLSSADLSEADLRGANLEYSNLSFANLTGTDLRGANLKEVEFKNLKWNDCEIDNCVKVEYCGKHKRNVLYLYDLDVVYCGCFMGSLEEFEEEVEEKYGDCKMGYEIAIEKFENARRNYMEK